jgi:hypothetical protein
VPSTVIPLVVVIVLFPVNVPELYTRTLPALTVDPFVTLRRTTDEAENARPVRASRIAFLVSVRGVCEVYFVFTAV